MDETTGEHDSARAAVLALPLEVPVVEQVVEGWFENLSDSELNPADKRTVRTERINPLNQQGIIIRGLFTFSR